ncbi:hypothetical protein KRX51_03265 [Corynebacterium sp. TAE3-ERU12]|uniref:hypothetical protein n=1 Tax=Corynebacterium sp. TAE3-ERU12 TaxID=2849491 RepID=UPI001C4936EF|nr:hypothetical protein [Corynebacterium sp. TAE3-ERU12]MBV7294938.1 hypothetical protein [Corynebacterium sp. TAE3-ERU12]
MRLSNISAAHLGGAPVKNVWLGSTRLWPADTISVAEPWERGYEFVRWKYADRAVGPVAPPAKPWSQIVTGLSSREQAFCVCLADGGLVTIRDGSREALVISRSGATVSARSVGTAGSTVRVDAEVSRPWSWVEVFTTPDWRGYRINIRRVDGSSVSGDSNGGAFNQSEEVFPEGTASLTMSGNACFLMLGEHIGPDMRHWISTREMWETHTTAGPWKRHSIAGAVAEGWLYSGAHGGGGGGAGRSRGGPGGQGGVSTLGALSSADGTDFPVPEGFTGTIPGSSGGAGGHGAPGAASTQTAGGLGGHGGGGGAGGITGGAGGRGGNGGDSEHSAGGYGHHGGAGGAGGVTGGAGGPGGDGGSSANDRGGTGGSGGNGGPGRTSGGAGGDGGAAGGSGQGFPGRRGAAGKRGPTVTDLPEACPTGIHIDRMPASADLVVGNGGAGGKAAPGGTNGQPGTPGGLIVHYYIPEPTE